MANSLELAEDEGVHELGHVLVDADDVQHARVAAVSGTHAVRRQVHDDQPGKMLNYKLWSIVHRLKRDPVIYHSLEQRQF